MLTIGTFNLNNLFSRFNFRFAAEHEELKPGKVEFQKVQKLIAGWDGQVVDYQGVALKHKDNAERAEIARRIVQMDVDILAIQEVEDIQTLRHFVNHELSQQGLYPHITLIEGNDPRLIDLAVLSKYPIGAVTTWQHAEHPDQPGERVFSRDLLKVEILNRQRSRRLVTIFNNHLKSHFVHFAADQAAGKIAADRRRQRQAETAASIIKSQTDRNDRFVVLGDMNDPVDSDCLQAFSQNAKLNLVNGLKQPSETSEPPSSVPKSQLPAWTHRFKPSGKPAIYELFDQIWLSPSLAKTQTGAFINRRSKLSGNGSDHDPAWVELAI